MEFTVVLLAFVLIFGLIIGSFLNVVILRTVSEESIVFPASKCPKCQTPLKWYHNIPVFSYLFLRGKCAFCSEKISIQYPLIELLTGLLFVGLFIKICQPIDPFFGLEVMPTISIGQIISFIVSVFGVGTFIALSGTDFIEKQVATTHLYFLIGIGVIYSLIYSVLNIFTMLSEGVSIDLSWKFILTSPISVTLITGAIGFLAIEILSRPWKYIIGACAFGDGDSYILAGIGTLFASLMTCSGIYGEFKPILGTLLAILVGSIFIQLIFALPLYVKKLIDNKSWLTIGSISALLIYSAAFYFAQEYGWLDNTFALIFSVIVLLALCIFTCKEILSGIKDKTTDGMYMPFGPALVVSATIGLFVVSF